jgi:hypothetical protein
MSRKLKSNSYLLILILFSILIGLSCNNGDKGSTASKINKSIQVVFKMSPATTVYKKGKPTPVFTNDPREVILDQIKGAGFKLVKKEDKPFDLKLAVEYHERATATSQYPGGVSGRATSVSISDFHFTLFDTSGQQLLFEKFDPGMMPPEINRSDAFDWFCQEIPQLIIGRLAMEDELSYLLSRVQTEDFVKILEKSGGRELLKRIGSFKDTTAIDVILPIIRVGNIFARWRAKYTLYTLGYRPQSVKEKAAWELIDLETPYGLNTQEEESIIWGRQMMVSGPDGSRMRSDTIDIHQYIAYYGLHGIKLFLEDLKVKRRKYFHAPLQDNAVKGLSILSKQNWKGAWGRGYVPLNYFQLDKITYMSKQEVYRKLRSKVEVPRFGRGPGSIDRKYFGALFREEWNSHATENLIAALKDTLSDATYVKDAITILGEISDKKAIEHLKPFLSDSNLGEDAKKAIQKIESR